MTQTYVTANVSPFWASGHPLHLGDLVVRPLAGIPLLLGALGWLAFPCGNTRGNAWLNMRECW